MASNSSPVFSFLSFQSFQKIERHIMNRSKYVRCLAILRNPSSKHKNSNFKYWVINTFKLIKVGSIDGLNVKSDKHNRGRKSTCYSEPSNDL